MYTEGDESDDGCGEKPQHLVYEKFHEGPDHSHARHTVVRERVLTRRKGETKTHFKPRSVLIRHEGKVWVDH